MCAVQMTRLDQNLKRKLKSFLLFLSIVLISVHTFLNYNNTLYVRSELVASITPDGLLGDWTGVTSTISDPDEPPSDFSDPFDISKIWFANQAPGSIGGSDYHLYFRWDRFGTTSAGASLEIPVDTNGDLVQDYFIWIDVSGAGGGQMNVNYAAYTGTPSTANKASPISGSASSYTGDPESSFEAQILASKLGLSGTGGTILYMTMRTRASQSFASNIKDCVNPITPGVCSPSYWIRVDTGTGSYTTTVSAQMTTSSTTVTATQTFTITPTVTVTATTSSGTDVTATPTVTYTPTVTVSTTDTTFTQTPTITQTITVTISTTFTDSIVTGTPTVTLTPTLTLTASGTDTATSSAQTTDTSSSTVQVTTSSTTVTVIPTFTITPTVTVTATTSAGTDITVTPTVTYTPTVTVSTTDTTFTHTPTVTQTITMTLSTTFTDSIITGTQTVTLTPTVTLTASGTTTVSSTVSESGVGLEQDGVPVRSLYVPVCTRFTLDLVINVPDELPQGQGMVGFDVRISWDPSQVEIVDFVEVGEAESRPWDSYTIPSSISEMNAAGHVDYYGTGSPWTSDSIWASMTFHCLGEGRSNIEVTSPPGGDTIYIGDGQSTPTPVDPGTYLVTCNQYRQQAVSVGYVGGESVTANKLLILSPYLTLIGLIALTLFFLKKRVVKRS